MPNSKNFIQEYGDISFTEKPFCDADNLAVCQMFYMPLEKVAPNSLDDEPVPFSEVCEKLYAYNGYKHKAPGLVLTKKISVLLMEMAKSRRYSEVKIVGCSQTFGKAPAVQFGSATLLLPDGTTVVVFRGTDDTLIGWKEDIDLYTKKGVPSHKLAADYINEVGKKFDGDIIVCGHSKGGNLALFGTLFCNKEVRDRIVCFYNNDGPGFHTFDYVNSAQYKEMLPRYKHFVPDCSLVGMLLAHDDDYVPVKSSRLLGPTQHDLSTWQVKGDTVIPKDDLKFLAKVVDVMLLDFIFNTTEKEVEALDKVADILIEATGATGLLDFAANIISSVKGAKNAWTEIDDSAKDTLKTLVGQVPDIVKNAVETVRNEAFPAVAEKVKSLVHA